MLREWGQTWSCLLEFGVWMEIHSHSHQPSPSPALLSILVPAQVRAKGEGGDRAPAREPSCSGAFQVRETTRGGRKELGDRDEPGERMEEEPNRR